MMISDASLLAILKDVVIDKRVDGRVFDCK